MKHIRIDKVKEENIDQLIEMLTELYIELGEESSSVSFLTPAFIKEIEQTGKTEIFLVKTNLSEPVALFTLTESQAIYAGGKYGCLDEMYVKPKFRSQLIGSMIIEEIKAIAIQRKWKRIDVTAPTEERWKRAVRFYEKNGFVFTGPKLKLEFKSDY